MACKSVGDKSIFVYRECLIKDKSMCLTATVCADYVCSVAV